MVAACALGMVNRNNKTHEGMIDSFMRFTMSDKSKYTLKLSKWSRYPTPFAVNWEQARFKHNARF